MDEKLWPTTEHYFQAMKFPTRPEYQEEIRKKSNPSVAKKMGQERDGFRPDWEKVKDNVMFECLKVKFAKENHPELHEILLSTGNAFLVEHTRNDIYWADGGDGGTGEKGKNMLGKLLVRVRDEILKP